MKRHLLLLAFMGLISFQAKTQDLVLSQDSAFIGVSEYIDYQTVFLENKSGTTLNLGCGIELLCRGDNSRPSIQICLGDQCFIDQDSTFTWNNASLTLAPGETSGLFKFSDLAGATEGSQWNVRFFDVDDDRVSKTLVVHVGQCGMVSVQDYEPLTNFSLYPNPASSFLNLDLEGESIDALTFELFNAAGQSVLIEKGENTVNVEALATGMYYYRAIVDNKAQFGKVSIN